MSLGQIGVESAAVRLKEIVPHFLGADPLGKFVLAPDLSSGLHGGGRRSLRRKRNGHDGGGNQGYVGAAQRPENVWLLLVIGRSHDLVTDDPERLPQIEAGSREVIQNRRSKGTMFALAVFGR